MTELNNTCVCCGDIIPEGIQVCYSCMNGNNRFIEKRNEIYKKNSIMVSVNTIEKVKRFVEKCLYYDEQIYVKVGKYVVDAKSIMGMFSIDLTREINVEIESIDTCVINKFHEDMREFILGGE